MFMIFTKKLNGEGLDFMLLVRKIMIFIYKSSNFGIIFIPFALYKTNDGVL
jgi:hypothetical protein